MVGNDLLKRLMDNIERVVNNRPITILQMVE